MDKQLVNCRRSRARMEIQTHGGRVCGWHRHLPVIYALLPPGGSIWSIVEVVEKSGGVVKNTRTSTINGCTVIWR